MSNTEEVELLPPALGDTAECIDGSKKEAEQENTGSLRIRIDNLPPFYQTLQVKKFLQKTLPNKEFRRMKCFKGTAYITLSTEEEVLSALEILGKTSIKKFDLSVVRANDDPLNNRPQNKKVNIAPESIEDNVPKTPLELLIKSVTPLANLPYEKQLETKLAESKRIASNFLYQLQCNGVKGATARNVNEFVKPVLPSPVIEGYRNKCEFTIGRDDKGLASVGFMCGKMINQVVKIVGVDECTILSLNTRNVVRNFESFIREFAGELESFDEFKREGFWKMLTLRDFLGDCMMIVTVYPHDNEALMSDVKKKLIDRFIHFGDLNANEFRVTSLYWNASANASDPKVYEHLAGAPYIYEKLLDTRFRISPSTFFQPNSRGAELLYHCIGDALELPSAKTTMPYEEKGLKSEVPLDDESMENGAKKPKLETENCVKAEDTFNTKESIVLLDVCCGAGTISLCCMKRITDAVKSGAFKGNFGCVGVEIIPEAIRDAHINCADNGFSLKSCKYFQGEAEFIFRNLVYQMPEGCDYKTATIIGVLDPPRAGVSDRVVIGCRKLVQMKRLVYVSCDPKAALKNLSDLCRPASNKFVGEPFRVVQIQPVDMFPQTEHVEWIVKLER